MFSLTSSLGLKTQYTNNLPKKSVLFFRVSKKKHTDSFKHIPPKELKNSSDWSVFWPVFYQDTLGVFQDEIPQGTGSLDEGGGTRCTWEMKGKDFDRNHWILL